MWKYREADDNAGFRGRRKPTLTPLARQLTRLRCHLNISFLEDANNVHRHRMNRYNVQPVAVFACPVIYPHQSFVLRSDRLIRFSLSLPAGSSSPEGSPTCLLRRLAVRGVEGGAPISPSLGEEEEQVAMPFPAMTTDSRHIVLVHARSQEGSKGASWGFGEEVQQQAGSAADTDVEKR